MAQMFGSNGHEKVQGGGFGVTPSNVFRVGPPTQRQHQELLRYQEEARKAKQEAHRAKKKSALVYPFGMYLQEQMSSLINIVHECDIIKLVSEWISSM